MTFFLPCLPRFSCLLRRERLLERSLLEQSPLTGDMVRCLSCLVMSLVVDLDLLVPRPSELEAEDDSDCWMVSGGEADVVTTGT